MAIRQIAFPFKCMSSLNLPYLFAAKKAGRKFEKQDSN